MSTNDAELTQNRVFELLSNARRRFIIHYLDSQNGPVELNHLVQEVAAWENDKPKSELTQKERKRMYVSLYQMHIPKLDEAGLVNYDDEAQTVELSQRATQLQPFFGADTSGPRWQRYYILVAVFDAVLVGSSLLNLPWTEPISTLLLVIVGGSFLVLAVVHILYEWRRSSWSALLIDETEN